MDGPLQPRGRGFKTNGTSSRPLSRNKHWINGQDHSGYSSDGWERGGGHRGRGRGRGRGGSGRGTPVFGNQHLTVPNVHGDTMSGAEDEGTQSDAHSANGMEEEEEPEVVEIEERELETPEEREKFYQEVRQYNTC